MRQTRRETRQNVPETAQTIPERSRGGPEAPQRALEISQKSLEISQTSPETHQMTPETHWARLEMLQREYETGWKALEIKQTVRFRNLFAPIPLLLSVKSECSTKLSLWPPSDWLKCAAENRFGHAAQKRTAIHPLRLVNGNERCHSRNPMPEPLELFFQRGHPAKSLRHGTSVARTSRQRKSQMPWRRPNVTI